MRKNILFLLLCILQYLFSFAQIKWSNDTIPFSKIQWDNYSTSFAESVNNGMPVIVTAIPYNGIYSFGNNDNSALDISFSQSSFRFRSNLSDSFRQLYTYDSSEVYFLAPDVFRSNANQYEYRVMLNGKSFIIPWSPVQQFTDNKFQLNNFKKRMAYLGGYKTTWDNYIVVDLRKKGSNSILSTAVVYWKQTKPILLNFYTTNDLNIFLNRLKKSYDLRLTEQEIQKWKLRYPPNELDSTTFLPKKLILSYKEDNLVFYLKADIYKNEAVEYSVIKDGTVYINWKPNDFDNNFIWLKNLEPGEYTLQIRYRAQRHNVTTYPFEVKPAWYQTNRFKLLMGILTAAFLGFIILSFLLFRQRQKTKREGAKKEKLNLELKAIRSQLNPHFVFNALNSIQGLVNKNDIAGANQYLSDFSNLMRDSLTGSNKDFTNLHSEITTLETYLKLEQLRFGFQYSIHVDTTINTFETDVPSLLLQPLVENAIKHGVSALQEKGVIHIHFQKENNHLIVIIQDNGNGFTVEQNSNGYGLKLTKERIILLNQILKGQSIECNINSTSGSGTIVRLLFKNWLS